MVKDVLNVVVNMSSNKAKKPVVKLPFPVKKDEVDGGAETAHNQVRPKPEQYADRTWMPPRGTRRSMGKR